MPKRSKLIIFAFVAAILGLMAGQVIGDLVNNFR